MTVDLSDRVVLVTGASRGIGAAIARLAAEAGATVALHYHQKEQTAAALATKIGREARPFQADLADPDACVQLMTSVISTYGRLNVLVNNAGIALMADGKDDHSLWVDKWDRTMAVNLRAAAILSRMAIEHFQNAGGGRIINIASRAAFRGDTPGYLAYAASKGGLVALSRSIARGHGKDNIVSFVVAPGFTRTDMARDFIDEYGESIAIGDLALNELTKPDDVAPTVLFLASGLADHATGATIDINAGSYVH